MLENEHPYLKILHEIAFQEPEQKISLKIFGIQHSLFGTKKSLYSQSKSLLVQRNNLK